MTIHTAVSMTDNMILVDMNGYKHPKTSEFVIRVLCSGWALIVFAILFNCLYYVLHPMAPELPWKKKQKICLFGQVIPREYDVENRALMSEKNSIKKDNTEEEKAPLNTMKVEEN